MKKITSFILLCVLFSLSSFCQEAAILPIEKKELKHEIAVDVIPLFNINPNYPDSDLFLTYKYKIKHSKLRISLASYNDSYYNNYGTYHNSMNILSSVKFGIEKSSGGKLISFIYGTDMLVGVHKSYVDYGSNSTVLIAPYDRFLGDLNYSSSEPYSSSSSFVAGISPFIGVNLNVTENVSLGGLLTTDAYYKFEAKTYNVDTRFHLTLNVRF